MQKPNSLRYPKIIGIPIVLISSYFLFLRINIKFYLKENYLQYGFKLILAPVTTVIYVTFC